MRTYCSLLGGAGCAAALSIFLAGSISFAQAPQADAATPTRVAAIGEVPALNLTAPAYSSSSSSSDSTEAVADARLDLLSSKALDAAQPPPRRRYGRPNYSDSHTNADGSSIFAFMAGAGAAIPIQDTGGYYTPSWDFQVGGGRNFNKNLGVLLQFDYAHFGLTGPVLANQINLYNSFCTVSDQNAGYCTPFTELDGNSHIWSFTLDPTFSVHSGEKTGAYVVAGVGFYHKVTNFTTPTVAGYYDPYYGPIEYEVNEVVDHYTSNAPGFDGGFGLTYKLSHFASERLYMEARYVFMANQSRTGYNATSNPNSSNFFPPNANHTFYIPVTVGLRF